jgi:cytochrome c-type biogenesis protein CcmH
LNNKTCFAKVVLKNRKWKSKIGMRNNQPFRDVSPTRRMTAALLWMVGLLLLAGMTLIFVPQASAQNPTPPPAISDDQVNAIAKEMYCPVCENTPLDVCPTQACAEWRELIREKLAEGWSEAQIKQYFVDRFGDRVLATPPARGLNWLVYVIPPIAILLGVFLLYSAFRAWRRSAPPPAQASPPAAGSAPASDEYVRRLEEELRNR